MLRERNEGYRTIKFVDISSDEYSPEDNQGLDYETVWSPSKSFNLIDRFCQCCKRIFRVIDKGCFWLQGHEARLSKNDET